MFVIFAHQPYSSVFSTQQLHQETLVCRQYPYEKNQRLNQLSDLLMCGAYLFKHFIQSSNLKFRFRARHFYTARQQPDNSSFDGQYQTSKCINSFLDSDVKKRAKNQLCFILYQDKAFEDKMNCQFQSQLRSQYSMQMFIFQLVEACHQYNKHKTDIINLKYAMHCLSFFINKKNLGNKLCVGTCLKCLTVATPLHIIN